MKDGSPVPGSPGAMLVGGADVPPPVGVAGGWGCPGATAPAMAPPAQSATRSSPANTACRPVTARKGFEGADTPAPYGRFGRRWKNPTIKTRNKNPSGMARVKIWDPIHWSVASTSYSLRIS